MKAILFIMILLSTWANSSFSQVDGVNYDWELKSDKDGISVYTSTVPDSKFRAVRATMLIQGKASSLVALVMDNDACPRWADLCKESKTIETVSDTESYVYVYNDLPFPVKDRDVLTRVIWDHDLATGKVSMTSTATQDRHPKIEKAVRIKQAVSQWHFTPQDDGSVRVDNFAHIDPNGATPAWITNMLLVSSPYKTMKNMRELIESGQYADSKVAFLP
jgi:hypothetical protein